MDNFKRFKTDRNHRAIDGILPRGRDSFRGSGTINFEKNQTGQNGDANVIGDFKRYEGYHPAAQPVINPTLTQPKNRYHNRPRQRPAAAGGAFTDLTNKKHHRVSWRKKALRGFVVLFLATMLTGGYLGVKFYLKSRQVLQGGGGAAALQENVDPSLLNVEGDGRVNILLLGRGGEGHTGPDLTDTLLLASIDPIHKEAAIVSIPRDLYVKVPGNGSTKINAVFSLSKNRVLNSSKKVTPDLIKQAEKTGLDTVQKIVADSLGIPVHYRVMVDFEAFRKSIDTVGGITIDVKERVYDPSIAWENDNNPLIAAVGVQTMSGKKALLYARSRHGSPRGDFDRSARQREVIVALKDKVLSVGTFSNPIKINQLLDAFGNHVQTDFNLNDIQRLYAIVKEIPGDKVMSIGLADPPNDYLTTSNINGLSVVVPRAGTYNYNDIHNYIRNTLRDGYLRSENASVIVLNGTGTSGLATKKADELKSYGYNVTYVGDAPTKNYQATVLVDLRGGSKKYTRHYLERRLGVTATGKLPDSTMQPGEADFVIILGKNETTSSQN